MNKRSVVFGTWLISTNKLYIFRIRRSSNLCKIHYLGFSSTCRTMALICLKGVRRVWMKLIVRRNTQIFGGSQVYSIINKWKAINHHVMSKKNFFITMGPFFLFLHFLSLWLIFLFFYDELIVAPANRQLINY